MRRLTDLRVVFMGTPDFAVPCLNRLLQSGVQVVAVVTGPDKPAGRGQKLRSSPVKDRAVAAGLPVLQPELLRDPRFHDALQGFPADLFVVVAFRILPPEIFTLPPLGTINVHASLLPKYRGAAPIQWAILRGEKETGITTFALSETVDTGDILLQRRTPIGDRETAGELHDRLMVMGAEVLIETIEMIASGKAERRPQEGVPTPAPKITREMAHIEWAQPAAEIVNLVRAMNPVPCAHCTLEGKLLRIYRVHEVLGSRLAERGSIGDDRAGKVIHADASTAEIWVAAGTGLIAIDELQLEGRKPMGADEFLRGYTLAAESQLQ